jgi:hypothetical protein
MPDIPAMDQAYLPLYQAQLEAAHKIAIDMNRRMNAMAEELRRKGFDVEVTDDTVIIRIPPESADG